MKAPLYKSNYFHHHLAYTLAKETHTGVVVDCKRIVNVRWEEANYVSARNWTTCGIILRIARATHLEKTHLRAIDYWAPEKQTTHRRSVTSIPCKMSTNLSHLLHLRERFVLLSPKFVRSGSRFGQLRPRISQFFFVRSQIFVQRLQLLVRRSLQVLDASRVMLFLVG